MHYPPETVTLMPESTNNPVMTANWCLTNLVLCTHWPETTSTFLVTALEASDSLKVMCLPMLGVLVSWWFRYPGLPLHHWLII